VPVRPVVYYRLIGIGAAFLLVVLTLVFMGTNLSLREGASLIMASEARFRSMFDAAPEAVFVVDPETRTILDANPFMAGWLGYDPAELIGLELAAIQVSESSADPGAHLQGLACQLWPEGLILSCCL
jgi:PAS domain-containing protein